MIRPLLFAFDIFGTVLDWRSGLRNDLGSLSDDEFDRIVAWQGQAEQTSYRTYAEIVAAGLVEVLGTDEATARRIGANAGRWPLYEDSADALRALMEIAPCVAMTNSDRAHGEQVRQSLGFDLTHWICAEDVGMYKPAPEFWRAVSSRVGARLDESWWHVSAYADYDLETARSLGCTTVFVARPHSVAGEGDVAVRTLAELVATLR